MKNNYLILIMIIITSSVLGANDVGVLNRISPSSGCALTSAEIVQVNLFNYGDDLTLTNIDISYSINGGAPVTESKLFTTFDSSATELVTFVTPADLSAPGTYIFQVYTSLVADSDNSNDTLIFVVENYPQTVGGNTLSNQTICGLSNQDSIFLTNKVGDVIQWEYSEDGGASWLPIVNTDTFQVYVNLTTSRMYRAQVQSGSCAVEYSDTTYITVDDPAESGMLSESVTACAGANGDTLRLSGYVGTISKWQIYDSGAWNDLANTTDTLSYSNLTSTTSYRVIVDNGMCPNDTSNQITISIVGSTIGGTIIGADSVCSGSNFDTLRITGYSGNILGWEYSSDGGFTWIPISNTSENQVYNNLTINTDYRVLVGAAGCVNEYSDTASILVDEPTEGGSIESDASVCGGNNSDTLKIVGFVGDIQFWEYNSSGTWNTINSTNNYHVYSNISQSTEFRALVKNGSCTNELSQSAFIAVIDSTVGGVLSSDATVCENNNFDTLNLTGFVGDIKWWEISSDYGVSWSPLINSSSTQLYSNLSQTTWYRVLVEGVGCPDAYSDSVVIMVDAEAQGGVLSSSSNVCSGLNNDTILLSGYAGNISTWQIDTGSGWYDTSYVADQFGYTNLTQTTSFQVLVNNGVCPQDTSSTVTISVHEPSVGGQIFSSDTVCAGDNGDTLVLINNMGDVISWEYSVDNGVTWVVTSNTSNEQEYSDLTTSTYYRVLIQNEACPSVYSDTLVIAVDTMSSGGWVSGETTICDSMNQGVVELNNYFGDILDWISFTDTVGASWVSLGENGASLSYSQIQETTFFTAIVQNGSCTSDTASNVEITSSITTADFDFENVCYGDSMHFINLSVVQNGAVNINAWEFADGEASIAVNPIHLYGAFGEYDVKLVVSTNQGCVDTVVKTVEVYELPSPFIVASGPIAFCAGDNVTLSTNDDFEEYNWSNEDTTQAINVTITGVYTVTVTDFNNCLNWTEEEVLVWELPVAEAGLDTTISKGQQVTLEGGGGVTYLWSPSEPLNNENAQYPVATPYESTLFHLTVTDENGCVDEDSVQVFVLEDYNFTVSNILTPNGDGYNDTWYIENIEAYPECQIGLFNRYGQSLLKLSNYSNDWDGMYNNDLLPDGTYYYVITAPSLEKPFKGHITLFSK